MDSGFHCGPVLSCCLAPLGFPEEGQWLQQPFRTVMMSHLLVVALRGGLLREVPVVAGTISSGDSPVSTALHWLPIFALGGPRRWKSALETNLQAPGTGFVHCTVPRQPPSVVGWSWCVSDTEGHFWAPGIVWVRNAVLGAVCSDVHMLLSYLYLRECLIRARSGLAVTAVHVCALYLVFWVVICDYHSAFWNGEFWFCLVQSPLGWILSHWKNFNYEPMTKKKMIFYDNMIWPQYSLDFIENWLGWNSFEKFSNWFFLHMQLEKILAW